MLKTDITTEKRKSVYFVYHKNRQVVSKAWLGGMFAGFYDSIMKNSIFPKKFNASLDSHNRFLEAELQNIHKKHILELATGSGNISNYLPNDNQYVGTDISAGLLRIAGKKFKNKNFDSYELFVSPAEDIPVQDGFADICICNLSLNFFSDLGCVIEEIKRTLKHKGYFICTVPIPERNHKKNTIRGKLHSENELKQMFENAGFEYSAYRIENGALLYFKATLI